MRRRYPEWRLTGVSAFIASDVGEVDALCESKLALFEVVVVFDRPELERAGIHVIPTFRTPHVTLAAPTAAELVEALRRCSHRTLHNPYHRGDAQEEVHQ